MLRETNTRSLINRERKSQATFFDHVIRTEKLELIVTTGIIEGKQSRGKQKPLLLLRRIRKKRRRRKKKKEQSKEGKKKKNKKKKTHLQFDPFSL